MRLSNPKLITARRAVNPFEWIRNNVSAKSFMETEFPDVQLIRGGRPGVYYGSCPIHQEQNGESFLVDETTGRICCYGKCGMKGADICEIAWMTLSNIPCPRYFPDT